VSLSASELERYRRHLSLEEIGLAGQLKLKAARVLVVGAGGLGSPSALYLAASGVGRIGIVDCDRVDATNLQRQVLFDTASLGRPKAAVARERLLALNPEIEVVAHELELRAANVREVITGYDLVLDGTDRIPTRYLVNDACVIFGKPLVSAAIHRFEGQVITCVPGRGPCYRCLYPEVPEGLVPNCAEAGVLGVLPGVVGALQATEAIKLIVGAGEALLGRLLVYDALELSFREFGFARRPDCAVCGDRPTIGEPHDLDAADWCATATAARRLRRLTPAELVALRDVGGTPALALVDVREPREFVAGHLDGAINLPLGELGARLVEVPPEVLPVFICRSGARSLTACGIALRLGRAEVANLDGGLLAWSTAIDPGLVVAAVR
jgi:sulfur-carrier protein adenylyltransferase/sulfurtransferase